jgi:hypothetical protein
VGDPNWFYSSLAQCTAALVGLLGAVLATRLQEQLRYTRATYLRVEEELHNLRDALDGARMHFDEFTSFARRALSALRDAESKNQPHALVSNTRTFDGSRSGSQEAFPVDPPTIEGFNKQLEIAMSMTKIFDSIGKVSRVTDVERVRKALRRFEETVSAFPAAPSNTNVHPVSKVALVLPRLDACTATHAASSAIHLPAGLTGILAGLSVSGLVVPLAYLSALPGESKVVLLSLSAFGILAIPAYLCWSVFEVHRLRDVDLDRPKRWIAQA